LKENDYGYDDEIWFYAKIEKRIHVWCNKWLSQGGIYTLIKNVLEATYVHWHSIILLYGCRKNIIKNMLISYVKVWEYKDAFVLVKWRMISKSLGGWGLKNIKSIG
jgi:hypothetical protein